MFYVSLNHTISNNLLSTNPLTKHFNYFIISHSIHYVFQYNLMKMMIGTSMEKINPCCLKRIGVLRSKSNQCL